MQPALVERLRARKAAATSPASEGNADPGGDLDFEAELQVMIAEARAEARAHELASAPKLAQAALTRATKLMAMLGQVDKRKPQDPDAITFSRAEIDRGFAEVSGLLAKLCERGVRCQDCNRELSIRMGRGQV